MRQGLGEFWEMIKRPSPNETDLYQSILKLRPALMGKTELLDGTLSLFGTKRS